MERKEDDEKKRCVSEKSLQVLQTSQVLQFSAKSKREKAKRVASKRVSVKKEAEVVHDQCCWLGGVAGRVLRAQESVANSFVGEN